MLLLSYPLMNVENSRSYMDDLYSTDTSKCLEALVKLKHSVIGSDRQKKNAISQGVIPRLSQLIGDFTQKIEIRLESVVIAGSLTKGPKEHTEDLIKAGFIPLLLNSIMRKENVRFTEHCLRVVSSLLQHEDAPAEVVFKDRALITYLLKLTMLSVNNQISVASILSVGIKNTTHQIMLWDEGAVFSMAALLASPHKEVITPTLKCIAKLSFENQPIAASLATASFGGKSVPDLLASMMSRDKPIELQLNAAIGITNLYKAGAISAEDPKIVFKALPVFVCLCHHEYPTEIRVSAAESLAELIEVDVELQRLASISNHLIRELTTCLEFSKESITDPVELKSKEQLLQAALKVFASLGANDEEIRKRIIACNNLVDVMVSSLCSPSISVKLSAIRCLHSLSRSVQQLRTTFQDHTVWKPLMQLLDNAPDNILKVASSTLCNLLLEFSPSKERILDNGAVGLLCNLTKRSDPALRLNGIWALMNMAFQADEKTKKIILETLGMEQFFHLLSDTELNIVMKTLGLLRNLLSTKAHIDSIMVSYQTDIMKAVNMMLDGEVAIEVKEQSLCVLANIADGEAAKAVIMNPEVLEKIKRYMSDNSNVKLQIAATFCLSNLAWREEAGSYDRQVKLKEMGFYQVLQQLVGTTNALLFDKVKTAMTQFTDI